jgi:hypothetical protein
LDQLLPLLQRQSERLLKVSRQLLVRRRADVGDEDMEDDDQTDGVGCITSHETSLLTHKVRDPPGLVNLGQTCYLNSSLQALRQIPQLQLALNESVYHSRLRILADPKAQTQQQCRRGSIHYLHAEPILGHEAD